MITTHQQVKKGDRVSHAVTGYVTSHGTSYPAAPALRRKSTDDEEVQLQSVTQLASPEEEELQMKSALPLKNHAAGKVSQRKDNATLPGTNHTGMPDQLKTGIENLSGYSMDDVKVHYNSSQPAQLHALAYAQGADIHVAPGEERHLPHEAWHVVQQKQGRVRPTMQMKEVAINDDAGLEKEADVMGEKAIQPKVNHHVDYESKTRQLKAVTEIIQRKKSGPFDVKRTDAAKVAKYSEYKDLDPPQYNAFLYDKIKAFYDTNLVKGRGYWDKLKKAVANFKAEDNGEFLKEQAAKHADYDSKFEKNYASNTRNHWWYTENVGIGSSGLAEEGSQVEANKDVPYTNSVSFEDNSISANHNYAERDMARVEDVKKKGEKGYEPRGLPNSEILWQQYKLAAKNQFWFWKDSRAKELMEGLSAIKRRQVQNTATQMTGLFALPDDKTDLKTAYAWQAESEEFLAMLGTPNCSGAAFLLADHVDDLNGKSITEIELLGGEDVNLDIKIG
jgi:hypothetical protein